MDTDSWFDVLRETGDLPDLGGMSVKLGHLLSVAKILN
jgi:hypothetical protein